MTHPYLRVYFGPQDQETTPVLPDSNGAPRDVTVPLGQVLPALTDAVNTRRAWLCDFEDDQVTISTDLYEVLQAYQELRPTG